MKVFTTEAQRYRERIIFFYRKDAKDAKFAEILELVNIIIEKILRVTLRPSRLCGVVFK